MAEAPKMKMGFKMGGGDSSKKRKAPAPALKAFAAGAPEQKEDEREFVTGVAGGEIESKNKKAKSGPLVIPLIANSFEEAKAREEAKEAAAAEGADGTADAGKPSDAQSSGPDDEYSRAARAIIEDLQRTDTPASIDNTKFAITAGKGLHLKDKDGEKEEAPAAVKEEAGGGKKKQLPILIANMVPGIDKIDDMKEKFEHDMAMRAEDQDPSGDRYEAVPVSLFGEAALRGMGWAGTIDPTDKKFKDPDVRPGRLGLGATPKPPESKKERRAGARKKDGARAAQEEKSKAQWEEMRKEKNREAQRGKFILAVEDLVEVYAGPQKGRRGIVRQTEGVPGLENVRLQLEGKKDIVIVSTKHVDMLSAENLEDNPFKKTKLVELNTDGDRFYKGVHNEKSAAPLLSKEEQERKKRDTKRERDRDRDRTKDRDRDRDREKDLKKKSRPEKESLPSSGKQRENPQWVVPMARVRVVSQKVGQGKYFKKKGVIQDVVSHKVCLLKMDESGKILEDIKQSVLETVIPSVGKHVVVVNQSNKYRNLTGRLMEKNLKKEKVYVQLDDVPDVQKFHPDDITEYVG